MCRTGPFRDRSRLVKRNPKPANLDSFVLQEVFSSLDLDEDGQISYEEYTAHFLGNLERHNIYHDPNSTAILFQENFER